MRVIIQRYKEDHNQTTGALIILDANGWPVFISPCIERGNRNNQNNVSSVPVGIYPLVLEYSPKFKTDLYELKNVPGRSECKIHASNYWYQLNGCISPGAYLTNLNNDKYMDLAASKRTLNDFMRILDGIKETTIEIIKPKS